ncbi:hypothetical protein GGR57DRAFT_507226 [Xylariaceae sp. FL1272]|nr:hypothetical protein GGR57DRAFT_507226 [Xylariaceae sp. FL1272]
MGTQAENEEFWKDLRQQAYQWARWRQNGDGPPNFVQTYFNWIGIQLPTRPRDLGTELQSARRPTGYERQRSIRRGVDLFGPVPPNDDETLRSMQRAYEARTYFESDPNGNGDGIVFRKVLGWGGNGLALLCHLGGNNPLDFVVKVGLQEWDTYAIRHEITQTRKVARAAHCIQMIDRSRIGAPEYEEFNYEPIGFDDSSAGEEEENGSSGDESIAQEPPERMRRRTLTRVQLHEQFRDEFEGKQRRHRERIRRRRIEIEKRRVRMRNRDNARQTPLVSDTVRTVARVVANKSGNMTSAQAMKDLGLNFLLSSFADIRKAGLVADRFDDYRYQMDRRDFILLEYCELGDLHSCIIKVILNGETIPNRVLWSFWLCMIRALIAMYYPPRKFHPGRKASPKNQVLYEEIPPPEKRWRARNHVHFDIDPRNIFVVGPDITEAGIAGKEHEFIPRLKLADFGLAERIKPRKQNQYYQYLRRSVKFRYATPEHFTHQWEEIYDYHQGPGNMIRPHGPEIAEEPVAGNFTWKTNLYQMALSMWSLITLQMVTLPPVVEIEEGQNARPPHYGMGITGPKGDRDYSYICERLRNTIALCLAHDPQDRPELDELLEQATDAVRRGAELYRGETRPYIDAWVAKIFNTPYDPTATPGTGGGAGGGGGGGGGGAGGGGGGGSGGQPPPGPGNPPYPSSSTASLPPRPSRPNPPGFTPPANQGTGPPPAPRPQQAQPDLSGLSFDMQEKAKGAFAQMARIFGEANNNPAAAEMARIFGSPPPGTQWNPPPNIFTQPPSSGGTQAQTSSTRAGPPTERSAIRSQTSADLQPPPTDSTDSPYDPPGSRALFPYDYDTNGDENVPQVIPRAPGDRVSLISPDNIYDATPETAEQRRRRLERRAAGLAGSRGSRSSSMPESSSIVGSNGSGGSVVRTQPAGDEPNILDEFPLPPTLLNQRRGTVGSPAGAQPSPASNQSVRSQPGRRVRFGSPVATGSPQVRRQPPQVVRPLQPALRPDSQGRYYTIEAERRDRQPPHLGRAPAGQTGLAGPSNIPGAANPAVITGIGGGSVMLDDSPGLISDVSPASSDLNSDLGESYVPPQAQTPSLVGALNIPGAYSMGFQNSGWYGPGLGFQPF